MLILAFIREELLSLLRIKRRVGFSHELLVGDCDMRVGSGFLASARHLFDGMSKRIIVPFRIYWCGDFTSPTLCRSPISLLASGKLGFGDSLWMDSVFQCLSNREILVSSKLDCITSLRFLGLCPVLFGEQLVVWLLSLAALIDVSKMSFPQRILWWDHFERLGVVGI